MAAPMLFLVLLNVLGARPEVIVQDDTGCVDADELARDLEALLPAEVDASGVRVDVAVTAPGQDGAREVNLKLSGRAQKNLLYAHRYDVGESDCADVPRLLSTVVRRQLDTLPRDAWAPPPAAVAEQAPDDNETLGETTLGEEKAESPPDPVVVIIEKTTEVPAAEPKPAEPAEPASPWRIRPFVAVGAGAGGLPLLGDAKLSMGTSLGKGYWPDAVVGLKTRVFSPVAVGSGLAQAAALAPFAAAAYEVDLFGYAFLVPRVGASFGGVVAGGARYDQNEVALLPWLSLEGLVSLYSRFGLFAEVGAEVPLVALVLEDRDGQQGKLPFVWGFFRIGVSWRFDVG